MFCPNCGKKMPTDGLFCPECGTSIENNKNEQKDTTLSEKLSSNTSNFFKPLFNCLKSAFLIIKKIIIKHKKIFLTAACCVLIFMICISLFNRFYDFTKIYWEDTSDSNITYVSPTTLNLSVLAYDKEGNSITDIKFEATSGEIVSNLNTVSWELPSEKGAYTITATAPSGKSIKKTVNVVILDDDTVNLGGIVSTDEESDDLDGDGILNDEEDKRGTNKTKADTDSDGITDYVEIYEAKTDPLVADTDGDGLLDGNELELELDPLKEDSLGDGIKDGERSLNYSTSNDENGVDLTLTGKGNIASTTIDVFSNDTFKNINGVLDNVYNLYTEGTLSSATLTIKYDLDDVTDKGISEDNLTIYYFNEEEKKLEEVITTVNTTTHELTAELSHFSKYVIGDKSAVITNNTTKIMAVIDNSVSMYSLEQMVEAGYSSSTGADGNDTEFKRLTLTNDLIDMFTGNYEFGIAEFSGNYVNLQDFTNDKEKLQSAVNSMKSNWNSNASGTNIITALNSSIKEFSSETDNNYVIILTDGVNTEGNLSKKKSAIIENANSKNIHICAIGLGSNIDEDDLKEIAEETGCSYYNASDASALDEIYSLVGSSINFGLVDTDDDNTTDGMVIADSGFIVNRDGFSFANFISNRSNNGHCYGMALFAMLRYTNNLPTKLGVKDNSRFLLSQMGTVDFLSNGYDLTNTYFTTSKNLYDFEVTTDALRYILYDIPSDYRNRVENQTWMINENYYSEMSKIGVTFSTKDCNNCGEGISKYQSALLNIDNDTFNSNVTNDEAQLLNSIWRLFILQLDDKKYSFNSEPDESFQELFKNLVDGVPMIIGINNSHAINAIKLIQDSEDANKFKIAVYDNNYPGEVRYIDVVRNKMNKLKLDYTAWTNDYDYTFSYDSDNDGVGEKITVQLAEAIIE